MRSSGWSSRSTWVCRALAVGAAIAALAGPGAALAAEGARLSIDPPTVAPGTAVDLVVSVPNATDKVAIDHVTIGIPQDFSLEDAEAKTGWRQSRTGQAVTWWGGSIPENQFARFGVRGTAPPQAETVLFNVVIGDHSGRSMTYHVPLEVAAPVVHDSSRSLAKAALVVACIAVALALGGGIAAFALWLKAPPL
ncbi:MAG TPA: hypothetical protein VLK36_10205 [Gaiellaceae bacterium]|nr:hypothetical protein [Gaiellaceae bacterium]